MNMLYLVPLFAVSVTAIFEERCGYATCSDAEPGLINVHIVPHTHDDVGWLKTVEEYYYGSSNRIQKAGVQYIIDSVVKELWMDPKRRFIYAETAFFWKWWTRQGEDVRQKVQILVRMGRLQFVGGAWSMNDEAAAHYQSVIDQFTWGLQKLNETFGKCGIPHVGWQIDPFGHSREFASMLAAMGYDGLFLGRIDYQDKSYRLTEKRMEMLWRGDDDLGNASDIFTSVLYNTYSPPAGFCFDILCDDEPIVIDPTSPLYNVDNRVDRFIEICRNMSNGYATNNILVTMGEDFNYQDAAMWYTNLDKLIEYVNLKAAMEGVQIKLFYSTPDCYLKAVRETRPTLPTKQDDFFPYASDPDSFWTGYFTSRPTTKYMERLANNHLQMAKNLQVLTGLPEHNKFAIDEMKSALGVMQHHDAITGTEKQEVARDYVHMLSAALDDVAGVAYQAFFKVMQPKETFTYSHCFLNESSCAASERNQKFVVTTYNPVAWETREPIRIPVVNGDYRVIAPNGDQINSQLLPLLASVMAIPTRRSIATHELVFMAHLHPLGIKSFYVEKLQRTRKAKRHAQVINYFKNKDKKKIKEAKKDTYNGDNILDFDIVQKKSVFDSLSINPYDMTTAKNVHNVNMDKKDLDMPKEDGEIIERIEKIMKEQKSKTKGRSLKRPSDNILIEQEMTNLKNEPVAIPKYEPKKNIQKSDMKSYTSQDDKDMLVEPAMIESPKPTRTSIERTYKKPSYIRLNKDEMRMLSDEPMVVESYELQKTDNERKFKKPKYTSLSEEEMRVLSSEPQIVKNTDAKKKKPVMNFEKVVYPSLSKEEIRLLSNEPVPVKVYEQKRKNIKSVKRTKKPVTLPPEEPEMMADEPMRIERYGESFVENDFLKIRVDNMTGQITHVIQRNHTNRMQVGLHYWTGFDGNNSNYRHRASGAYIFRPRRTVPRPVPYKSVKIIKGPVVEEIMMETDEYAGSSVRVYVGLPFIEHDYVVGPIDVSDNVGKEYIVRYNTDIINNGVFYTDSNGRQMLKRKLNQRPQWNLTLQEPVAGNYYPVTNDIYIEDNNVRVSVLTDRAQGGSSLHEGSIELMLHRRLLHDDGFGVGEALNETADGKGLAMRGKHRILIYEHTRESILKERQLVIQTHLSPLVFVADATHVSLTEWLTYNNCFKPARELPLGLHLLTLEPWDERRLLIRLENYKDNARGSDIEIDLNNIFPGLKLMGIRETTLAANRWMDEYQRWRWNSEGFVARFNEDYDTVGARAKARGDEKRVPPRGMKVTIKGKQIRTFIVEYGPNLK